MEAVQEPQHRIRARYTADTITVYQAYAPAIGVPSARCLLPDEHPYPADGTLLARLRLR